MRETSIVDNLNCKTQAHARVCEENKKELEEKNDCPLKYFMVKRLIVKGCTRRMAELIEAV